MKEITKQYSYIELQENELTAEEKTLIETAKKATETAYVPYSNFRVGAAVMLSNGVFMHGSNQENGAYPSGLCAERTVLFSAGAQHPDQRVKSIAIAAYANSKFTDEPITPCGACRQVMQETENRAGEEMTIFLYGSKKILKIKGVKTLLPFAFNL